MTIKTRTTLNSEADTAFNDNTAADISAADSRNTAKDQNDSMLLMEDFVVVAKAADYSVLVSNHKNLVAVTTSSTDRTMTLPAAATAGNGFEIAFIKVDTGTGAVIIDGSGAETIEGDTTIKLFGQYDSVIIRSDGSNWLIVAANIAPRITEYLSGSGTFTPSPGSFHFEIWACAGGGAGGGTPATGGANSAVGGGGSTGASVHCYLTRAEMGASRAYAVGAAGSGVSGADGGAGGNTTFGTTGAVFSLNGGAGGIASTAGTAVGGVNGVDGGTGTLSIGKGEVQGGAPGGNGARIAATACISGEGGSSPYGGGGKSVNNAAGNAASGRGAGGGGASSGISQSARLGGAGTAGFIRIKEFFS